MPLLKQNIPLSEFSNYKIGGPAEFFFEAKSIDDLETGLSEFYEKFNRDSHPPIFILGSGTNVLIDDKGFEGLVIRNLIVEINDLGDNKIYTGSGNLLSDVVGFCLSNSLSGLEWAGGLPGTVGGAVRGNAGAFKGETKDSVIMVKSLDLKTFEILERLNSECDFSYRSSIFKTLAKEEIILGTTFQFEEGIGDEVQKATQEKIDYRKERHPLEYPNIGSTFKNVPYEIVPENFRKEFGQFIKDDPFPIVPVAKLLALSDLKGEKAGGAQISEKHPNFIVNLGNASSEDVKTLIGLAKKTIKDKYGIELEEEIYYL